MKICPSCFHERTGDVNEVSEEQCPNCQLVYSEYEGLKQEKLKKIQQQRDEVESRERLREQSKKAAEEAIQKAQEENSIKQALKHTKVCKECAYSGSTKTITPGSFIIEVVLWICFILPGLVYSLWRHSARREGCPKCGSKMLSGDTPIGEKLLRENYVLKVKS